MKPKTYSLEKSQILTHRGLEPNKENFYSESSYEAFRNHLERGFGIEFDVNFTKDNQVVIVHDSDLERITRGEDKRLFGETSSKEIKDIQLENGRLCFFEELMKLIIKSPSMINALHLKGKFQQKRNLDILLDELSKYKNQLSKILIFDVKIKTAKYLLSKSPQLLLAPSVAHWFDIKRYNDCVLGTLISIAQAIRYQSLFTWVWLDEWDRTNESGKLKKLYTKENFERLRKAGYKIALVTPELHRNSPGLLGEETHQDAQNKGELFARIKEIIDLKPDAICTDYPQETLTP